MHPLGDASPLRNCPLLVPLEPAGRRAWAGYCPPRNTTFLVGVTSPAVSRTKYVPAATCRPATSRPSQVTAYAPAGCVVAWTVRINRPATSYTLNSTADALVSW